MPRAGGIFSLIPGYFAVDGTTIEVSQHNPPLEDIAQALTDSLPRDGSAPMTGNLAMGSNKITGLAAATLASDAVRFDQLPTFTPTTATLTAGTDAQGQGPITTDQVTITTAAANPSGATLPTAVAGKRVIIANRGANPVNIYPATGAAIGALAANAPVLLAVNQSVEFFARSATQWEGQISQPLDADLTAVAGLSTTGLVTRTGAGTMATRQITSPDGSVAITNPAGIAGDIQIVSRARVLLATKSASASATIDFTEFNNAIYSSYYWELDYLFPATNGVNLLMRFSTNGGSSYDSGATDYFYTGVGMRDLAGPANIGSTGAASIQLNYDPIGNTGARLGARGTVRMRYAASSAFYTEVDWDNVSESNAGAYTTLRAHGKRALAQDTDAVRFFMSSGNIASGTIRMYGSY